MTKTLPGSAGPAHQPFRRPGVGRPSAGARGQLFPATDTVGVKLVRPELAELDEFRQRVAREVRSRVLWR